MVQLSSFHLRNKRSPFGSYFVVQSYFHGRSHLFLFFFQYYHLLQALCDTLYNSLFLSFIVLYFCTLTTSH